jgi:hypothetical protein
MVLQYGVLLRNAQLDAIETTVSTQPKLQIRTGTPPSDCAQADSGTLLVEITAPSDWLAAAASGSKAINNGPWSNTAVATGTAGHFRLKNNAGSTTHMQGTVGAGSGDLSLDNTSIATSQTVSISVFTITAANA